MREMRSIVFKIMDRWIHVRVVRTSGERRGTVSDIPRVFARVFLPARARVPSMRTRGVRRVRRALLSLLLIGWLDPRVNVFYSLFDRGGFPPVSMLWR